jgi:cytidine deaminase
MGLPMTRHQISISYSSYTTENELPAGSLSLLKTALENMNNAYAPYSHFQVSAAIRLSNGQVITGSNQENAAYPSGMCAERSAIYYAGARFPQDKIEEILVVARREGESELVPACPCGSCRQAMLEYEERQSSPIRLVFKQYDAGFIGLDSVSDSLPFKFGAESLGS